MNLPTAKFKCLYDLESSVVEKINCVCKEIYGAKNVEFSTNAKNQMAALKRNGWDKLPICIAKTQYSFSDNAKNIELREYISDMDVCMAAADLVICRAGAMTMSELAIRGSTAIFIPSPNVTEDHQYKNAKVIRLEQNYRSTQNILDAANSVIKNHGILTF